MSHSQTQSTPVVAPLVRSPSLVGLAWNFAGPRRFLGAMLLLARDVLSLSPVRLFAQNISFLAACSFVGLILCVVSGGEPAPEIVEEVRVPQAGITVEALQNRVPLDLSEYQRLKRQASIGRETPTATRLIQAEYSATYSGHRFTDGRLAWTIEHPDTFAGGWKVDPLGLALQELRWGDLPAVWGTSKTHQFEVIIDRSRGVLTGAWELEGETVVRHDEFAFRVPPATVSTLKLRVPTGYSIQVPGQTVLVSAAAEPGWNLCQVSLGSTSECRISVHPPAPPGVATPFVLIRSQTAYGIRQEGLRFFSELGLEVSQAPIREVTLSVDAELEIYSVLYGDIALPWKTETLDGRQQLVVTLPEPLIGTSRLLRLRGVAPIRTDSVWKLPQLSVDGTVLASGQADVRITPPLQLQQIQADGYLQTSIETTSARDDQLTLKQLRRDGSLRVSLGKPQPRILARVLSDLQTKSADWSCVTQLQLSATEGAAFDLRCRIPVGWDVIDVRDINSPKLEWSIVTPASGERLLELRFLEALAPDKPRTIEIEARRGSGYADQTFAIPAFEPLGIDRLQMLVGVSSAPEVKPVLEAGTSFEPCEREDLDSEWSVGRFWQTRFVDNNAKPLLLLLKGIAPEGHFTLQSLQTPVEVSAEMQIEFLKDKVTKTITLEVTPQQGRTDRVLVYQSVPGPQLNWVLAGTPPRPIEARTLPTFRHAAWDLPTTGELWELRLPQPQATPFVLEGGRTRGLPPTGRLGLVFVPQARTFRGHVHVTAPADLGLELTAQLTEADGVTAAMPGPLKQSWSFHQPGALLKFQTRVPATQVPAPVIRRVTLEARWPLESDGFDYYLAKLELGSGFPGRELRIGLPDTAEAIEIQVDRQPIPFQLPKLGDPIVLTNVTDEQVVAVAYRSASEGASGPVQREILLPRLSIPVLRFDLELMTPAQYRLGSEPHGMVLKTDTGSISTLQRLFGPLGRSGNETWFNPFSAQRWSDLFLGNDTNDEANIEPETPDSLDSIHAGWRSFHGSAALLPDRIEVWLWSYRQANGIAWLAFFSCLLIGATCRLARISIRGFLGATALIVEILLAFTLPSVPAQIAGACLAGTLLAALWPRAMIARPATTSQQSLIPQDSTQSYRVSPRQLSGSKLSTWGFLGAICLIALGAWAPLPAQTPAPSSSVSPPVNGSTGSGVSSNGSSNATGQAASGQTGAGALAPAASYRVLIPTNDDGTPFSELQRAYVPVPLIKAWSARYSREAVHPDWLIQSGEYQVQRDATGQVMLACRFDVVVLSTESEIEAAFPLTGMNFGGSTACLVNGQPQPILSRENGQILALRLPGAEPELKPAAPPMPEGTTPETAPWRPSGPFQLAG